METRDEDLKVSVTNTLLVQWLQDTSDIEMVKGDKQNVSISVGEIN